MYSVGYCKADENDYLTPNTVLTLNGPNYDVNREGSVVSEDVDTSVNIEPHTHSVHYTQCTGPV